MSNLEQLFVRYEQAVARLIAHAALHAPHFDQHELRDLILRGEQALCDACQEIRTSLVHAATHWRTAHRHANRSDNLGQVHEATAQHLGLVS